MTLAPKQLLHMYRQMWQIRLFEEEVESLFMEGQVTGSTHLYIGQEAVAVGACAPLEPDDYITSGHRGHGHCIAKGGKLRPMMAELLAKETGYCRGKGGSMHIADMELGILGANGIVGGGIPLATGAALASVIKGSDQVALSFFGDGGANQGCFHESANLAAAWRLPVVYICENNLYAMTTPGRQHLSQPDIALRASGYGFPGVIVDGQDILAVYEATAEAVDRARSGEGPTLLECKTYRYKGHYVGDPIVYRTDDEVAEWQKRDPILIFQQLLEDNGLLDSGQADAIRVEVAAEIDDAVQYAIDSPEPPIQALWEDVYVG
jgi:pyruvate dehydrogenase E1 component alpha subunit